MKHLRVDIGAALPTRQWRNFSRRHPPRPRGYWEHVVAPNRDCSLDVANEGPHTLDEVAAALGVSPERIRQLEQNALESLRMEPQLRQVYEEGELPNLWAASNPRAHCAADEHGNALMKLRAHRCRHRVMATLVQAGADLNYLNTAGQTPLMDAVVRDDRSLVRSLSKLGADPNFMNDDHETALSYAAVWGRSAIAALLLDGGSRVDHPRAPRTPLMYAAREGNARLARQLMRAGANVSREDRYGRTAHDIAIENGHDSFPKSEVSTPSKKRWRRNDWAALAMVVVLTSPMSAEHSEEKPAGPGELRAVGSPELFITVFITGAAVMTVEIVGTRLIGPVFGVGLFVWSALLAVTLASLAGGYYGGGVLADRHDDPRLLGRTVVVSGVALALAPLLHRWALGVGEGLGMRSGPLFAATFLFAPSLVCLGAAGPISVKLATKSLAAAGRGIGGVYAVSTAGSLVGTLVVGFVLIPVLDATAILGWTAAVLILLGGISLARRKQGLALGLMLLPMFIGEGATGQLPPGLRLLDKSQSLLGLVEVILDENRGVRFLRSDHSIIGATFESSGTSAFAFVDVLAAVRFLQPQAKSCLNIGLGTGAVPSALGRQGIKVDVVEIDPAVVELTEKHFGFVPSGNVYVEDARAYLQRTDQRYDLVVHDTFTGGTTPEHLLSLEVLERIRALLRPGGVFALNFVGYYGGPDAEATFAVARTVRAVFPHVRAYRDSAPEPSKPVGNIAFFASFSPLEFKPPLNGQFDSERTEKFVKGTESWPILEQVPPGPLVTDARNPLARLQLPIAEKHFEAMNEMLPAEVWLN